MPEEDMLLLLLGLKEGEPESVAGREAEGVARLLPDTVTLPVEEAQAERGALAVLLTVRLTEVSWLLLRVLLTERELLLEAAAEPEPEALGGREPLPEFTAVLLPVLLPEADT